jgi:predicted nucleic acid-binding protein
MVNIYFLDTSALVKRYVTEIGSVWVQTLTDPLLGNALLIVRITWVEVLSALARRQREGSLTSTEVTDTIQLFRGELNSRYRVMEVDSIVLERAGELILQYPLRAYDAVQLASALRLQSLFSQMTNIQLVFVSADDRLLHIAQSERLVTENPNSYP